MRPTDCWVIFDTCTRQPYYQDVHNLLALPPGSVLRYQYRAQRLSAGALAAAATWQKWDSVLLVYAQSRAYTKKSPDPTIIYPFDQMLWVPTRLATMRFLKLAAGDIYYFDLLLGDYPDVDDSTTADILSKLHDADDVPYLKWVATVNNRPPERSDMDSRWNKIVDRLGVAPSQFAADTFWRLESTEPAVRVENDHTTGQPAEARSYYVIYEPDRLRLAITTYTAQGAHAQGALIPNRALGIGIAPNAPIDSTQPANVALRPYTSQPLVFRANRSELLDDRETTVRLITTPDDGGWASGPNLDLQIQVRKKAWKLGAGTILLIVGALVGSTGVVALFGSTTIMGLAATVVGGLLILAGTLLMTGKLALKL